jgi:hypothetical protein
VETETALVRAKGRVELHTVSPLDLALALVVLPDYAELDDALGDGGNLESLLVLGVLLEERGGLEGRDELWTVLVVSCRAYIRQCSNNYCSTGVRCGRTLPGLLKLRLVHRRHCEVDLECLEYRKEDK